MVFLSSLMLGADKPDQDAIAAKLRQAGEKMNIFELPSFRMKADVTLEVDGALVRGNYTLLWNGPRQWREEVELSKYKEVQIGGKGVIWMQRSTAYIPPPIVNLRRTLGFGTNNGGPIASSLTQLAPRDGEVIKKQEKRKEQNRSVTCYEIEDKKATFVESCLTSPCGDFDVDKPVRSVCLDDKMGSAPHTGTEDELQEIRDKGISPKAVISFRRRRCHDDD